MKLNYYRELTLKRLGLIIKYMSSEAFYKNGLGLVIINELGRRIAYQVLKGVKITSLNLWQTDY